MGAEKKKEQRGFISHALEVLSYIGYTVSVYYMSHFSIGKEVVVDDTYRAIAFLFVASTFMYFKGNGKEIFKEMIKSGCILISCQLLDIFLFGKEMELGPFIHIVISQFVWQSASYAFAYVYNSTLKDHGKYTNKLIAICLSALFFTLIVFKLNVIVCFAIFAIVFFRFGFHYYFKNKKEQMQEIEKKKELKEKQLKAERQEKQRIERMFEENSALKEENKKLRAKLNMINTKNKRKRNK